MSTSTRMKPSELRSICLLASCGVRSTMQSRQQYVSARHLAEDTDVDID
jgi:hypothetical protein